MGEQTDAVRHFRTADDRDADFNGAVADDAVVEEAWRVWRAEVANAETFMDGVADVGSMVPLDGDEVHGPRPAGAHDRGVRAPCRPR